MRGWRSHDVDLDLLRAVEKTNERQKLRLPAMAQKHFGELDGKTFAVWGLAFKPRTDDMREAPAVTILEVALFVVTEWSEFRAPDLERVKSVMRSPVVFDGRTLFDPCDVKELGFTYYGIGRPQL